MFKTHGGLFPHDPKLADALTLLPEDKKGLVDKSGGLEKFLLMSPQFKSHGELICLFEDSQVIAASIDSVGSGSSNGLSPDSDIGMGTKKKKSSKKSKIPSPPSVEAELSKYVSEVDKTKTYGEELSSGVNSATNSPRLLSPVLSAKTRSRPGSASSGKNSTNDNGKSDPPPQRKSGNGKKDKTKTVPKDEEKLGSSSVKVRTINTKHATLTIMNGLEPGLSEEILMSEWERQVAKVKSEFVTGDRRKEKWGEQKPVLPANLVSVAEQKPVLPANMVSVAVDARPLMTDKWVMTDQITPVENFKDRYEIVLKEKADLQEKLERSEDQRFKMQRDHRREVEKVQRQSKGEAKEVSESYVTKQWTSFRVVQKCDFLQCLWLLSSN